MHGARERANVVVDLVSGAVTPGLVFEDTDAVYSALEAVYAKSGDANLDADQVQKFTFELCHMYGRSTKIVSQPAPTYYADLAAEQAPFLMKDFQESGGSWEVSSATGTHASGASAEFVEVSTSLQNRLFFA